MERKYPIFKNGKPSKFTLWVDIETTGLDPEKDLPLEVAFMLVNSKNDIVYKYSSPVHHEQSELEKRLTPWCAKQHRILLQQVKTTNINLIDVTTALKSVLLFYCSGSPVILAGSSVEFDQNVIRFHMPELVPLIHYQVLNVTSILIMYRSVIPNLTQYLPPRSKSHRAQDDIVSSFQLYKCLRNHISNFKKQ